MLPKRQLLAPDHLEAACLILRALMHPVRLRLCELLLRGDCTVGDLASTLALRPNVVSQHLNHLRAFGIVTPRRLGRTVHYVVTHPGPGWLLECIGAQGPGASGGDGAADAAPACPVAPLVPPATRIAAAPLPRAKGVRRGKGVKVETPGA